MRAGYYIPDCSNMATHHGEDTVCTRRGGGGGEGIINCPPVVLLGY